MADPGTKELLPNLIDLDMEADADFQLAMNESHSSESISTNHLPQFQGSGMFALEKTNTRFQFLAHDWESVVVSFKDCSHNLAVNSTEIGQKSTCGNNVENKVATACAHNKCVMVPTEELHLMSPETLMQYCLHQESLLHGNGAECLHNNSRNKLVVSIENITCNKKCMRKIECGHFCRNLCHEECTKTCEELVSVTNPFCDHTVTVKCSEKSVPRQCCVLVLMLDPVGCNHRVSIPCHRQFNATYEELMDWCTALCTEASCQHKCEGTCRSCSQGKFHIRCNVPCTRILDCGHVCARACCPPYGCPPCLKPCEMNCAHGTCQKKCGKGCDPCQKPCTWECKHKKCTKLCSEECDRDMCTEPCDKLLPCGCACIGYCGEPCPPLCLKCDKDAVQNVILTGTDVEELDQTERFIYLGQCKHTLEYRALEQIMSTTLGEETMIRPKTCPLCRTGIWDCRPFSKTISEIRKHVVNLKKSVYGDASEIRFMQLKCLYDLTVSHRMDKEVCTYNTFREYLLNSFVIGDDNFIDLPLFQIDQIHMLVNIYGMAQLRTRQLQVFSVKKSDFPSIRKGYELFVDYTSRIFSAITERVLPMSYGETIDCNRELERLTDLFNFVRFTTEKCPADNSDYMLALDVLEDPGPYTKRTRIEFHRRFRRHWVKFCRLTHPDTGSWLYEEAMNIENLNIN